MSTHEIEDAFVQSWDWIEQFYRDDLLSQATWRWLGAVPNLLSGLRERGFDGVLRAGQSLFILILSRSREYGLRDDQPFVAIEPQRDGSMKLTSSVAGKKTTVTRPTTAICAELLGMLERLRNEPVT
jgi:hypothetical protein